MAKIFPAKKPQLVRGGWAKRPFFVMQLLQRRKCKLTLSAASRFSFFFSWLSSSSRWWDDELRFSLRLPFRSNFLCDFDRCLPSVSTVSTRTRILAFLWLLLLPPLRFSSLLWRLATPASLPWNQWKIRLVRTNFQDFEGFSMKIKVKNNYYFFIKIVLSSTSSPPLGLFSVGGLPSSLSGSVPANIHRHYIKVSDMNTLVDSFAFKWLPWLAPFARGMKFAKQILILLNWDAMNTPKCYRITEVYRQSVRNQWGSEIRTFKNQKH